MRLPSSDYDESRIAAMRGDSDAHGGIVMSKARHRSAAAGIQIAFPLVINKEISLSAYDHRLRGAQVTVQYMAHRRIRSLGSTLFTASLADCHINQHTARIRKSLG